MANMKRFIGPGLAIGHIAVMAFQVYLFYHFAGEALHANVGERNASLSASFVVSSQMMTSASSSDKPPLPLSQSSSPSTPATALQPTNFSDGKSLLERSVEGNQTKTGDVRSGFALAGEHDENNLRVKRSNSQPGLLKDAGHKEHQDQYGSLMSQLALTCQFAAGCGLCLSTYLAWMIGIQKQYQFLYHLAGDALVTVAIGLFATAAWASSLTSKTFVHQWQFWPFILSYVYNIVTVIPFLALDNTPRRRRARQEPHRMTEAEWRRWQHVQERTRQVDQLVEAAGGGDVIYSQNPDGSWRLTRWRSDDDQGEGILEVLQTEADVEAGSTPVPAAAATTGRAAAAAAGRAAAATGRAAAATGRATAATGRAAAARAAAERVSSAFPEQAPYLASLSPGISGCGNPEPDILLVISGNQLPPAPGNPTTTTHGTNGDRNRIILESIGQRLLGASNVWTSPSAFSAYNLPDLRALRDAVAPSTIEKVTSSTESPNNACPPSIFNTGAGAAPSSSDEPQTTLRRPRIPSNTSATRDVLLSSAQPLTEPRPPPLSDSAGASALPSSTTLSPPGRRSEARPINFDALPVGPSTSSSFPPFSIQQQSFPPSSPSSPFSPGRQCACSLPLDIGASVTPPPVLQHPNACNDLMGLAEALLCADHDNGFESEQEIQENEDDDQFEDVNGFDDESESSPLLNSPSKRSSYGGS